MTDLQLRIGFRLRLLEKELAMSLGFPDLVLQLFGRLFQGLFDAPVGAGGKEDFQDFLPFP